MKKIIYLAPALLLGLVGKGAMADQNTHISRLDAGFMTSLSEPQQARTANANKPEQEQFVQNKDVKTNKVKKTITTHISSLDGGIIEDNAKANETNETKYVGGTNTNSLDNNSVENNTKAVQYNTFSVKTNIKTVTNFTESKVTDGNSDQHTIEDPSNDQITIHYVDENGKSISGLKDYTIDLTHQPQGTTKGQFNVPDNRYVLPDPNKQYDITNLRKTIHHDAITHVVHHPAITHEEQTGHYEEGYHAIDSNGNSGTYFGSGDDAIGHNMAGWAFDGNSDVNGGGYVTSTTPTEIWVPDGGSTTVVDKEAWDETVIDKPAYNETKGSTAFSEDNTLNIKSVIGNTINVILKHRTKNVDAGNSDMVLDSWRKVHVINSDNQSNLINESVKFKVGYTLDLVSLAKVTDPASYKAVTNPDDFIGENKLTDPVGFSAINTKLLSISL